MERCFWIYVILKSNFCKLNIFCVFFSLGMMKLFVKVIRSFLAVNIFSKSSIINIWQGPKYTFEVYT